MSAHDVRHRVASVVVGSADGSAPSTDDGQAPAGHDAVADRVPAEYRDAYLEGFARARAISTIGEGTAA